MGFGHRLVLWCGRLVLAGLLCAIGPGANHPVAAQSDPPALVGRIARIEGSVNIRDAGEDIWRAARMNLPVPPGDIVATEASGQTLLDIAASRFGLASETTLRLDAMDGQALEATLMRGEIYLRLLHMPADATVRVHTPRGIVRISGDGRFAVAAGDQARPTVVTALEGTARLDVPGTSRTVAANQAARIDGGGPYALDIAPARISAFMVAMMARDPSLDDATPELVSRMTGAGDLARYGAWRTNTAYGAVWVPRVETGWVPYRDGVWAWVRPWGWTWVDDAPWGFAPFHYGRWTRIGPDDDKAWAWVPEALHAGVGFQPAYAPALVAFLGLHSAAGQTVTPDQAGFSVLGWTPLGPEEAYRPGFPASADFVLRLNRNHVRLASLASATGDGAGGPLANADAITIVPAWAMRTSRPVQLARLRLLQFPPERLKPLAGTALPGPTPATLGMTPRMAEGLGLAGMAWEHGRMPVLPVLRPAGSGSQRAPGAAPGPEIVPMFPGVRRPPAAR